MCAVLEDAIECLAGHGAPRQLGPRLAAQARAWIEDHDREWPFSFENICETLDLDAERLRTRLLACAPNLPVPETSRRRRNTSPDRAAIIHLIRSGQLHDVARMLRISVPQVSSLSQGLVSPIRASRDADIRRLRRQGWTHQALATHFELSRMHVMRICARCEPEGESCGSIAPALDASSSW